MAMFLICYLFHWRLERAVDERREDVINSRVTFPLKRSLSRYETSLGQMLPSQAPARPPAPRCSCACVVYGSDSMFKEKSLHAENCSAWGGETWRERKGKVNAWNRWPTDQALPLHEPRGGINNKERPWKRGRGGEEGPGASHAPHAALLGRPREEAFYTELFAREDMKRRTSLESDPLQSTRGAAWKSQIKQSSLLCGRVVWLSRTSGCGCPRRQAGAARHGLPSDIQFVALSWWHRNYSGVKYQCCQQIVAKEYN